MVAQQILVLFVLVRIQVEQHKKKPRYSIRVARLFVVDIMFLFVTKPFGHLLYTGFLTIHENTYTVYFGGKPSETDG